MSIKSSIKFRKYILLLSIIGLSLYGVIVVWLDNALSFDRSLEHELHYNGNVTIFKEYTYTIENYVPWTVETIVKLKYNPSTGISLVPREYLELHNFILHDVTQLIYYSEKVVSEPRKKAYEIPHNYSSFQFADKYVTAPLFTKAVTTIKYSYEYKYNSEIGGSFSLTDEPSSRYGRPYRNMYLFVHSYPINIFFPTIIFILSGYGYAYSTKEDLTDLIISIHSLKQIFKKKEAPDQGLRKSLKKLTHYPNLIDDGWRVFLTPATTLLKMNVRRKVTRYYHKGVLKSSREYDLLSKFLKNDLTKPSNSLLEFRVIALIVGLLASIGFSFTWNFDAIRPVLIAFGLLTLYFNIGFLIFLFPKSLSDFLFLIGLAVITLGVMVLEHWRWNLTNVTRFAGLFMGDLFSLG